MDASPQAPPEPAAASAATLHVLMVMGVSGSGKTTIGEGLAGRLGWPYRDADDFHPPANKAKMAAGTPLTDEDRWPWLDAIRAWIDEHRRAGTHGVVTCSALKRVYRDRLVGDRSDVRIVYLQGSRALLAERMGSRHGHFMPASLLESQLATLEPPGPDEHPITVSIADTPEAMIDQILDEAGLAGPLVA